VEKYDKIREATDDNIIDCKHFACWLTKATGTHLEYVAAAAAAVKKCVVPCVDPVSPCFFLVGLSTLPRFVLATKLMRPFTLMFSQSFGFKNTHPKVLYLLHASAGQ